MEKYKRFILPKDPQHIKNKFEFRTMHDPNDGIYRQVAQIAFSINIDLVHKNGKAATLIETKFIDSVKQDGYERVVGILAAKLLEAAKDLQEGKW